MNLATNNKSCNSQQIILEYIYPKLGESGDAENMTRNLGILKLVLLEPYKFGQQEREQ